MRLWGRSPSQRAPVWAWPLPSTHLCGRGPFPSFVLRALRFPPQILIYHPAFIKYVFDSWLQGHGRYPSTGILSVIFSLHVCDEVCRPPTPHPLVTLGTGGPHSMSAREAVRASVVGRATIPTRAPPEAQLPQFSQVL